MLSTLEILPPLACGELDASFSFQARYAAQTKAQEWLKALRPPRGKEEVQEKTGAFVNGNVLPCPHAAAPCKNRGAIHYRRQTCLLEYDFFFHTRIYFPASGQAVVPGIVPSPLRFLP